MTKIFRGGPSEVRCARRMHEISLGNHPLHQAIYSVADVAERYEVHVDTAFKGIRRDDGMFPVAQPLGEGVRPRLSITPEAMAACDRDRLSFYKTTPSWTDRFAPPSAKAPPRRSARNVIAEARLKAIR